jgi:hypothetical protein
MKLKTPIALAAALAGLVLTGCQGYSPTATGWEVLFDGESVEQAQQNFQGYLQPGFPNGWALDGTALKTVPGPGDAGADLMTRQMYSNFELEFEWAVSAGGNGGVIYRVATGVEEAWHTGPEYQVLDDARHADGRNPLTSAGSLYALIAPSIDKMAVAVGKFNQGRIIVNRGHVEHWLNGRKVVEYKWGSAPVQALIARSKFAPLPQFMKMDNGYLVFQHHGEEVWYRKIRVRRL